MAREMTIALTMVQNITINLDTFESEFGLKPTRKNVMDVAIGHRAVDSSKEGPIATHVPMVVESEIIDTYGEPDVEPRMKRGRGSY